VALTPAYLFTQTAALSVERFRRALGGPVLGTSEGIVPLEIGASAALVAPLQAHGKTTGVLTLAGRAERPLTGDVSDFVSDLAERAGVALENARLYRERLQMAHTLEQALRLPVLPEIPGLEVAAWMRLQGPEGEIGGDFYELYKIEEDTWAAIIGDAMGKGIDAATMTFAARHSLRTASLYESSPGRTLSLVNESIFRYQTPVVFCTMSYARVSLKEMRVTLANGGQPLPLLLNSSGEVRRLGSPGLALGAFRNIEIKDCSFILAPGEHMIFYTDGLVEAEGARSSFREEELISVLAKLGSASAQEIILAIKEAVFGVSPHPQDDIAVLILSRPR
jgi:serine phosphatase RsbU (regulator of sigma subunit)